MIMKILITGYCILFVAIIANTIANTMQLYTWYNFIEDIMKNNFKDVLCSLNLFKIIWLFLIYPFCLSIGYKLGEEIHKIIF
ncbi:MAG: hypothetical protein CMP65_00740 [Flavobacteriales bacterium]|nr:hypothetical protein [Flavobacteriales bacterium]